MKRIIFQFYKLLEETFVAHMRTNQYCTLRTVEDKLELYSGIVYEYEQFPNDATSQRKRELLSDYLDKLIEGINEQLQKS